MAQRIPATIITGFLGAGKTTLIRHLLQHAGGRRIALSSTSSAMSASTARCLTDCGDEACKPDDIIELANGCICCTVADDFIPTMEKLIARDPAPDHIVIETSGLALPQPLVRAFNWPEVRARVTVDGVVTVIDARAVADGRFAADEEAVAAQRAADDKLDHESPLHELFEDQLACADLIILNKSDLVSEAEIARAFREIADGRRSGRRRRWCARPRPDRAGCADRSRRAAAEDDVTNRLSHHELEGEEEHDHDDFESFVVAMPPIDDPRGLSRNADRRRRATCRSCAPRVFSPWTASRCAWPCRASARASTAISTVRCARTTKRRRASGHHRPEGDGPRSHSRTAWRCPGFGALADKLAAPPAPVPTPCIDVCTMDEAAGLCLGCARTAEEIGAWAGGGCGLQARCLGRAAGAAGAVADAGAPAAVDGRGDAPGSWTRRCAGGPAAGGLGVLGAEAEFRHWRGRGGRDRQRRRSDDRGYGSAARCGC